MGFFSFIMALAFIGAGYVGLFGNIAGALFSTSFTYDNAREPKRWAAGVILYWVLATILTVYICSALELGIAISIGIIILGIICCIYFLGNDAPVGQCPECGEWFSYVRGKYLRGGHYYADDVVERDIKNRNGEVIGSYETTEKRIHGWSTYEYTCKKCGNTIKITNR